jgi:DNA-binding helix-hairpin-helix protein with protein kinase domain
MGCWVESEEDTVGDDVDDNDDTAAADEEEEALMGGQALYSEHRSNFSNRPKGAFLSARDLGKTIDDLFHKTFVDGLLNPNARPTASNWADALADAFDRLGCISGSRHHWHHPRICYYSAE